MEQVVDVPGVEGVDDGLVVLQAVGHHVRLFPQADGLEEGDAGLELVVEAHQQGVSRDADIRLMELRVLAEQLVVVVPGQGVRHGFVGPLQGGEVGVGAVVDGQLGGQEVQLQLDGAQLAHVVLREGDDLGEAFGQDLHQPVRLQFPKGLPDGGAADIQALGDFLFGDLLAIGEFLLEDLVQNVIINLDVKPGFIIGEHRSSFLHHGDRNPQGGTKSYFNLLSL